MGRFEVTNAAVRPLRPAPRQPRRAHARLPVRHPRLPGRRPQAAGRAGLLEPGGAFCAWLSARTGKRCSLPTEAQWEYACRAGSATPYAFGRRRADYSGWANLGDRRLREFALETYVSVHLIDNPGKYDDWVPRDDRFDDGGFVSVDVGKYRPNAWGLHDMHGNVWEWTRSI